MKSLIVCGRTTPARFQRKARRLLCDMLSGGTVHMCGILRSATGGGGPTTPVLAQTNGMSPWALVHFTPRMETYGIVVNCFVF